jgi:CRP-like cAMP-binding protein
VSEPGAVFGELSILLDQPHTADVRALEVSQFYLADEALIAKDPLAFIYIATILARRLNYANRALIELKRQLHAGEPQSAIAETIAEIECNLVYAGYPFNPFISRLNVRSASATRRGGSQPTWRSYRSYCETPDSGVL